MHRVCVRNKGFPVRNDTTQARQMYLICRLLTCFVRDNGLTPSENNVYARQTYSRNNKLTLKTIGFKQDRVACTIQTLQTHALPDLLYINVKRCT
jgi:hypothetical protein